MKASFYAATALVGIAAASSQLERRGCGDNCANAVAATRFGQATFHARLVDCSSYLRETVTPSPVYEALSYPSFPLSVPC
jgi:hypothetical protein